MSELDLRTTALSLADAPFDHDLYISSLRMRYDTFVKGLGWDLPNDGELETDQYDTLFSIHIIVSNGSIPVGTIRILPTTHDVFGNRYMILDADCGNLPNLPTGLMDERLVSEDVWEASRLALSPSLDPKHRNAVMQRLVKEARDIVKKRGGKSMLGLMNPVFVRIFNKLGISCARFGPTHILDDGPVCVIKYDF